MMREKTKKLIKNYFNKNMPECTAKKISMPSLFGGFSVNYDDIPLGRIFEQKLYLKGHPEYIDMLEQLGMKKLESTNGVILKTLSYYQVHSQLWDDENKLEEILGIVLQKTLQSTSKEDATKILRIKDLPNINFSLERTLSKLDIKTAEQFISLGANHVFFELEKVHRVVSINLLYIFHCAIKEMHVARLSYEDKQNIQNEYHAYAKHRRQASILLK